MRELWRNFGLDRASAVLTWGLVAGLSLYFMIGRLGLTHWRVLAAAALFALYIGLFFRLFSGATSAAPGRADRARFAGMYLTILGLYFCVPDGFTGVLAAVWCAMLPYFMPVRLALWLSPLLSLPLWLVYRVYWGFENAHFNALLLWALNVFAIISMNNALQERRAREAAHELNRKLQATQVLLTAAGRQSERVRIARNIHDLLGHHLTALSIHLQVAARRSDGEVKQAIEQCHAIAGLLLSDVREAVSDLREQGDLDLHRALGELTREIPRLEVELAMDATTADVTTAETILACVQESLTNSLRHSTATHFRIGLSPSRGGLALELADNGTAAPAFTPGNGMRGLRERVADAGGDIRFDSGPTGFTTRVWLPGDAA